MHGFIVNNVNYQLRFCHYYDKVLHVIRKCVKVEFYHYTTDITFLYIEV